MHRKKFEERYKILPSGCWEWQGTKNFYGYGVLTIDGQEKRAHRVSYERTKGPIPEGMVILHSCDNPPCVNPDHLSIGTRFDNRLDAAKKNRLPAKLTPEQISRIRTYGKSKFQWEIAEEFGVTQSLISRILSRQRRTLL